MKILYFANLKEIIGKNEENIEVKGKIKIQEIIDKLKLRNKHYKNAFERIKNLQCSVNCEYVDFNQYVKNDDEIAFFPPVTGG